MNTIKNTSSPRHLKQFIFFLVVYAIGMLLGTVMLSSTLSLSYVFLGVATLIALPISVSYLRLKDYFLYFVFELLIIFGTLSSMVAFGVPATSAHILFFSINIYLIFFVYRYVTVEYVKDVLDIVYKRVALLLLCYFSLHAFYEIIVLKRGYIFLGFDDKSHAVIIASFLAFICLKLFKGVVRYIYSFGFLIIAALTASKFVAIFAAFFIFAVFTTLKAFIADIRNNRDGWGALRFYLSLIVLLAIIAIGFRFILTHMNYFYVLNRLQGDVGGRSGSTEGHFLLIGYGVRAKFANFCTLLFGIGPGEFSNVISSVNAHVDLSQFSALDPTGFAAILRGVMPMHSVIFSIFVEFPFPLFIAFVILMFNIFTRLFKNQDYVMLSFFVGFMMCTSLYSTHDELIYYFILYFMMSTSFSKPNSVLSR